MPNDDTVNVRYMVDDVEASIAFYTELLGFEVLTTAPPAFADVRRGNLRLLLAGPKSSAGRPMPDGERPGPGGWNRIHFIVDDLDTEVGRLREAGARFRNDVVEGPGGRQILLQDPSGNIVELFQPAAALNGTTSGTLRRRLGVGDAVMIGAGSMIGAGVFTAWAPAAEAAGNGMLVGLAIAAVVALCNATSSAQLAAVHPQSGGTYVYGRRQLGPGWGHLAGWGFVVGKIASCAAMALTAGAYLWPEHERAVAVAAVVAITLVNIGGLTRTVAVTRLLLATSLTALGAVVVAGWSSPAADLGRLTPIDGDPLGIVRSAGFLFFAFAGYARIATLGEEVRDPETTIPKAILRALLVVLGVYLVVGVTASATVGSARLASTDAPLRLVADAGDLVVGGAVVRVGAGVAALGALLNLIPGVSRTALAMARRRELPRSLAHIDPRRSLPVRAELGVAAIVITVVAVVELRSSIAISGVAVLTYYAITNAAVLTLRRDQRRWPPAIAVVGLAGCVALIASLPPLAILTGTATLALGVAVRAITSRPTP